MRSNGPARKCDDSRPRGEAPSFASRSRDRSGFSLIELLIVLAVTVLLTALLMPALSKLHENVNRVRCSNNLKQIGMGLVMYTEQWRGHMPPSVKLHPNPKVAIEPQELMASFHIRGLDTSEAIQDGQGSDPSGDHPMQARRFQFYGSAGETANSVPEHLKGWDGLGLLHQLGYCRATGCYYCPSHSGDHPIERYTADWVSPGEEAPIYINYHYSGHIDWETRRRRFLQHSPTFVVATDGLRTTSDFNHGTGLNILYSDISVEWRGTALTIYQMLPDDALPTLDQMAIYNDIWMELDRAPQNPDLE